MQFSKLIRLTLIVLAVGSFTFASAQSGPRGPRGPRGQMLDAEKLKTELNLSTEQSKQIEELTAEHRNKMEALKDKDFESPEDRREAMKTIMEEYQSGIKEVLTDEQAAKMKALREEHREMRQEKAADFGKERKAMRKDMETYREENILPVLKAQRTKLEAKISAQDKAKIAELRSQLPPRGERPQRLENPTIEQQKAAKEQFAAKKEKMNAHKEQVQALVKKYEADIDALYAEIKPQTEKWKADMQKIAAENRPQGQMERKHPANTQEGAKREAKDGRGMHGKRERGGEAEEHEHHNMHKAGFLLLDPNAPATPPATQEALTEIKIFPNPAVSQNTLSYTVKQAGHLRIELHNESGRTIQTLFDGNKEIGEYQLNVDLSKLQNGVYYYTVIDQSGKQSHKVILNK